MKREKKKMERKRKLKFVTKFAITYLGGASKKKYFLADMSAKLSPPTLSPLSGLIMPFFLYKNTNLHYRKMVLTKKIC